jgi:hypothetical protein
VRNYHRDGENQMTATVQTKPGEPFIPTSEHTPGPWEVVPEDRAESRWVIGDEEGGSIASCEPAGPWITLAQADANARLISAAPELLAALKIAREYVAKMLETVQHVDDPVLDGSRADFAKIEAAITKATKGENR